MSESLEITIAHSPDADDAFMFYPLSRGLVPTGGVSVRHHLADIQSLNEAAALGRYEVTAISFHAYAHVTDRYALATCGSSVGDGYGPLVVSKRPLRIADLAGQTIAVPGLQTTAYLALKLVLPEARCVVMPFDRIMETVASGDVAAGLVIHEGQLTYGSAGLVPVLDLGEAWKRDTGLPLPLGGNAIRKDLGPEDMARVARLMRTSIDYALGHRVEALEHAMAYARGTPAVQVDRFVGMYVNDYTRDLGPVGRKAVELLLARAHERGLVPRPVVCEFVG